MKFIFRIIFAVLIIWVGIAVIRIAWGPQDNGLLSWMLYLPGLMLILFTVAAWLLDASFYAFDQKIIQYSTTGVALLIILISSYPYIHRTIIDQADNSFVISGIKGTENFASFELKSNLTYRLVDGSLLGASVYYGRYQFKQDTIYLSDMLFAIPPRGYPDKGLIKGDTVYWNSFPKMIIEKESSVD